MVKHNHEFVKRLAATIDALKAAWPVSIDGSRDGEGELRNGRTASPAARVVDDSNQPHVKRDRTTRSRQTAAQPARKARATAAA